MHGGQAVRVEGQEGAGRACGGGGGPGMSQQSLQNFYVESQLP